MVKYIIALLISLMACTVFGSGYATLTNKSGYGTTEDSITVTAYTTSNTTGLLTAADSMMIIVINPKGDSVYSVLMAIGNATINTRKFGGAAGTARYIYRYTVATATIIGATAYTGLYTVIALLSNNAATQEDCFIMTFNLNPTLGGIEWLTKKYFYNPTYPWVVDSIQYVDPRFSTVGVDAQTALVVKFKPFSGNTKPDTSGVGRK